MPADPAQPIGAVVDDLDLESTRRLGPDTRSHPLWIEAADLTRLPTTGGLRAFTRRAS